MQENTNTKLIVNETESNLPTIPEKTVNLHKARVRRIKEVRVLYFIRGWTRDEIAEALKVTPRQIENDITTLRKEGKTLGQIDIEYRNDCINFIWELNDKYQERVKHLWNMYSKDGTSTKEKTDILTEIRKQEQQHFDNLQSLGIVPKEAQKFIHGVVYVSKLKGTQQEDKPNVPEQKKPDNPDVVSVSDAILVTDASS
jgi:hypothetical protein